jgi:hypothetical protein
MKIIGNFEISKFPMIFTRKLEEGPDPLPRHSFRSDGPDRTHDRAPYGRNKGKRGRKPRDDALTDDASNSAKMGTRYDLGPRPVTKGDTAGDPPLRYKTKTKMTPPRPDDTGGAGDDGSMPPHP